MKCIKSPVAGAAGAMLLLVLAARVEARRGLPQPLLETLSQGYGVVALTVTTADLAADKRAYSVHGKVESIPAAPVAGGTLPLKPGEEVSVTLSVGYAQAIETMGSIANTPVLPVGARLLLTLKYNSETKTYEQVGGASSVRFVQAFDERTLHPLMAIRELAAAAYPARFARARADLLDPLCNDELTYATMLVFRHINDKDVPPEEQAETLELLRKHWHDLTIEEPFYLIENLDETLQAVDPRFDKGSDLRVDVWLRLTFSPLDRATDPNSNGGMGARWNRYLNGQLPQLASQNPDKIIPVIIREMNDMKWPTQFRIGLALAIQQTFQESETANTERGKELQRFYPVILQTGDAGDLGFFRVALDRGQAEPKYSVKRRFVPEQATWDAITSRVEALQKQPADAKSQEAVRMLKGLLNTHQQTLLGK